ncbi:MAG: hypothetical protein IT449_07090 [Phycisphaerales bacterium]|nr:hypothetical protein [Phycisphaerales bacterium]
MSTDSAAATHAPPPDWSLVRFPVGCPRCGTDLHGQSDVTCPKCALTFDWADLVPVDELISSTCGYRLFGLTVDRCPECSSPFTWEEALLERQRRKLPLLEYWWKSRFVRSSYRTWRMTLRPRRLWRTVRLHHAPRVMPLLGYVLLNLVGVWLAWISGFLISQLVDAIYEWWVFSPTAPLLDTVFNTLTGMRIGAYGEGELVLPLVTWMCALGLSLLLFTQSMRRLGLKLHHLVRIWAYGCTPWLLVTAMSFSCCVNIESGWIYPAWTQNAAVLFMTLCLWWYMLSTTWSIRQGLAHYIGMRHALGVAISAQLIAILAAMFASIVPFLLR